MFAFSCLVLPYIYFYLISFFVLVFDQTLFLCYFLSVSISVFFYITLSLSLLSLTLSLSLFNLSVYVYLSFDSIFSISLFVDDCFWIYHFSILHHTKIVTQFIIDILLIFVNHEALCLCMCVLTFFYFFLPIFLSLYLTFYLPISYSPAASWYA